MAKIDKLELENKAVNYVFKKNLKMKSYREKSPLLMSALKIEKQNWENIYILLRTRLPFAAMTKFSFFKEKVKIGSIRIPKNSI